MPFDYSKNHGLPKERKIYNRIPQSLYAWCVFWPRPVACFLFVAAYRYCSYGSCYSVPTLQPESHSKISSQCSSLENAILVVFI